MYQKQILKQPVNAKWNIYTFITIADTDIILCRLNRKLIFDVSCATGRVVQDEYFKSSLLVQSSQ